MKRIQSNSVSPLTVCPMHTFHYNTDSRLNDNFLYNFIPSIISLFNIVKSNPRLAVILILWIQNYRCSRPELPPARITPG